MEIVALPVQLAAQTPTTGEVADVSTAPSDSLGKGVPQDIFAALLAQQLGAPGADPLPDGGIDVGKAARDDADELTAEQADQLAGQLGLPGLVALSSMKVTAADQPSADDTQDTPGVNAKEILAAGRQPVAVASAVLAEKVTADMPAEGAKGIDLQADPKNYLANPVTSQTIPPNIAAHAPVATPQVAQAIPQSVSSPAWGEKLGDRVVWMVGQQQQSAELHLNPPTLGPLEIRLNFSDGQANLTFSTQHLPVREALEAATPRLREMLGESGISLGSVSVNVGSFTQQQPGEQREAGRHVQTWSQAATDGNFNSRLPSSVMPLNRNGMVDIFA